MMEESIGRATGPDDEAARLAERERALEERPESEERFRELFETAGDAIITVDSEQRIVLFNKQAEAMFGYQVDEVIGRPLGMLLPADVRGVHEEHVKHFAGGDVDRRVIGQRATLSGLRSDGVMFPVEIAISKRLAKGEFEFTSVVRDITERKEMEDAVDAYAKSLERSNVELEEYATVAAHDLQEPLRKIEIFADRIVTNSADELSAQSADYLERLGRSVHRMRALIDDLLSYAQVSAQPRNFESVDLGTLAGEVIIDLTGGDVIIDLTGGDVNIGHLPVIDADPIQMSQLLRNLIGNALKFHRPDIPPMVTVEGQIVDDEHTGGPRICRLTVRDNGIGFDEMYADQIFSMFQRLHGVSEYPGAGIGLALCRRIVEHHGGDITVTSTPGEGSTFVVSLPVTHDPEPGTPLATEGTFTPNRSA
jgi:PAS domain S-box-containing protein